MAFHENARAKVQRHHTDIVKMPARRSLDADVIVEEDYLTECQQPERKPIKKAILVARHNTEVLRKRPTDLVSNSPQQNGEIKVTRRTLSRHGSRIQQSSRAEVLDEPGSATLNFIKNKSIKVDKSITKRRKELEETSSYRLQEHTEYSSKFSQKTPGFEQAFEKLQISGYVILTGRLGSGKTYTALNLVKAICDRYDDYKPVILQSTDDLQCVLDTPKALVVLADNFLGQAFYNQANITHWNRIANHITSLLNRKRIFLIATCDSNSLQFVQNQTFLTTLDSTYIVNLDCDSYILPFDNCKSIINNNNGKRNKHILESLKDVKGPFGLPLLLQMAINRDLESVTQQPVLHLLARLEELCKKEFLHYLALVVTMLLGGTLSISCISPESKSSCLLEKLFKLHNIEIISIDHLMTVSRQLLNIFLSYNTHGECFEFLHISYYYATMHVFLQENTDDAIQLIPIHDLPIAFGFKKLGKGVWELLGQSVSPELTQNEMNLIITRYGTELETKKPGVFRLVSESVFWRNTVFVDLAIAILGIEVFFSDDTTDIPFAVYLIKAGNTNAVGKILNFVAEYRQDSMEGFVDQVKATILKLCETNTLVDIDSVLSLFPNIDASMMSAAAKGGNVDILQFMLNNGGQLFTKKTEVFEAACSSGHVDLLKFLFDEIDADSKYAMQRRKDTEGKTVLHHAAMAIDSKTTELLLQHGANPMSTTKDGISILHVASSYGRLENVKYICEKYPDIVNLTDNNGLTAAHFAALEGHVDVLEFLLRQSINPTVLTTNKNTILHLAAYNGRTEVIRYLCRKLPAFVTFRNNESYTAPQLAAISGNWDSLQVFFTFGIDPFSKTVDGRTFLHLACFHGKLNVVKQLCTQYPEISSILDNDGNNAAHDSAASGKIPVLEYLIENFINPHRRSNEGCTLLHDACYYGKKESVVYIANTYPDMLNEGTNNGYTACHGAALGGFVDVFDILVEKGADPYALSTDDSTMLHEAVFSGKMKMVQYLCDKYPSMLNKRNKRSYQSSHFAAQEGHLEVLQFLLSRTNDPLTTTEEQQTFLHIAAYNGRMEIVKYLCRQLPEIIPRVDANKATAIHYAARGGHVDILAYLIGASLDPTSTTANGSTILHLAAYDGKFEMVQYICRKFPKLIAAIDKFHHSAIHYAAGSGNVELLQFILNEDVDPYLKTDNGGNILLKAAYMGKFENAKYLIETYPEMMRDVDSFGCSITHYAVCGGNIELLKYAISLDIDPMTKTKDGHTLLHIAAFHGQLDMVKYLYDSYPSMRRDSDNSGYTPEKYAAIGEQPHIVRFFKKQQQLDGPRQVGDESSECTSCLSAESMRSCIGRIGSALCCCRRA